jgi:tetratricopeptide (TPR) repeat protein
MSSDAEPDQHSSVDGWLRRAELLADLGRYDDAVTELGQAVAVEPGNPAVLGLLAQVQLAAGRPEQALTAADAALAAGPDDLAALAVRGLALADLRRFGEAAATADRILALGPNDGYAQRTGAAILAEARNGQPALNAAWRAVELAPEEPRAHLVLGLVALRLGLHDLAEKAYREALRLDPELAEAQHNIGVVRLEQRRYQEAMEHLTLAAALRPAEGLAAGAIGASLRRPVLICASYAAVCGLLVAVLAAGAPTAGRVAAVLGAVVGALLLWRYAAQVPPETRKVLPGVLRTDRGLALSAYATAATPVLLLLHALLGGPWPLVATIAVAAFAEIAVLRRAFG